MWTEEDAEVQERDQLRYDRHKERERQRRLARAHPDKRSKLDREKDRDVTEKIALGMPSKTATQESMFDQRLFNQSQVSSVMVLAKVHHTVTWGQPFKRSTEWPHKSSHDTGLEKGGRVIQDFNRANPLPRGEGLVTNLWCVDVSSLEN
jgi:hypothetical protein